MIQMPKKPEKMLEEIKQYLAEKGFAENIQMENWQAAFMIKTGYGRNKIYEWTENFELMKLITTKDQKINFLQVVKYGT